MILRTALVTGAGRGYGLELCRGLAARGAHVFGTVRGEKSVNDLADCDELANSRIDVGARLHTL